MAIADVRATVSPRFLGARTLALALAIALSFVAGGSGCSRRRAAERPQRSPRPDKFIEAVRARAPFDLSCTSEQVTIVQLGQTTLGAQGCGRQTSYSCLCSYYVWFNCAQAICALDGAATTSPGPSPAAPPPSPDDPNSLTVFSPASDAEPVRRAARCGNVRGLAKLGPAESSGRPRPRRRS